MERVNPPAPVVPDSRRRGRTWFVPIPSGVAGVPSRVVTVFRDRSEAAELALVNSLGGDADGWTFKAVPFSGGHAVEVRDGDGVILGMI